MRKVILTFSLFFLLLATPSYTLAIYPNPWRSITPSATKEGVLERLEIRKELREQKREEIKDLIKERKATISSRLAELRRVRIRFYFGRLVRRLEAAINRLERLIERIESRLEKFEQEDEDLDTTSIHENLNEAKHLLDESRANIEASSDNLESVLDSENPHASFSIIRDIIKDIKENLIEVHRILVHVIGDIKGLRTGQSS